MGDSLLRADRDQWQARAAQAEARVEELLEAADVTRCECHWSDVDAGYPLSECGWHSRQRGAKEQAEAERDRLRAALEAVRDHPACLPDAAFIADAALDEAREER